jgi:cyclophilin family peptidyl-prolyl cis-trans isomerase
MARRQPGHRAKRRGVTNCARATAICVGRPAQALAGRDSGGSQWFVMHSRAPHLDGRYTWRTPVAVGGVFDFLPDVPGGLVTYAVGALVLYRHLTRKARA